jgi:hypothetical protein
MKSQPFITPTVDAPGADFQQTHCLLFSPILNACFLLFIWRIIRERSQFHLLNGLSQNGSKMECI